MVYNLITIATSNFFIQLKSQYNDKNPNMKVN